MHEEQLFEMVNEAVEFAKSELETKQKLHPFAMMLFENGDIESLQSESTAQETRYEELITLLKKRVADDDGITPLPSLPASTSRHNTKRRSVTASASTLKSGTSPTTRSERGFYISPISSMPTAMRAKWSCSSTTLSLSLFRSIELGKIIAHSVS